MRYETTTEHGKQITVQAPTVKLAIKAIRKRVGPSEAIGPVLPR